MSNVFRIDAAELAAWSAALSPRTDVRGVAAIAKEIDAHLAKREPDDTVVVSRHQLFTWAEALQGASARGGPDIGRVAAQMSDILRGRVEPGAVQTPSGAPAAMGAMAGVAPLPAQRIETYREPPPVQYTSAPQASGPIRLLSGADLAATARDLVRSARSELYVSSPWDLGLDSLVADVVQLPPTVRVLILSRRPAQETSAYHQTMDQLGRRRAVTVFSPFIQTRLIVQDVDRALVGAASVPGPNSREAGLLLTDRAAVAAVRAHFERVHAEGAGPAR